MLEIEFKAILDNNSFQELEQNIISKAFTFAHISEESDSYFNAPDRNFAESDEALRVRVQRTTLSEKAMVTYKGAKVDAVSNTRFELETEIGDADTMQQILNSLGYSSVLTVDKKRRLYQGTGKYSHIIICLDELAGLGKFIEIEYCVDTDISQSEAESIRKRLLSLLDDLGIPRSNLTRKSYLELLMERATS